MPRSENDVKGFTLIELTIVIAIVGILMGALAQGMTLYVIKSQQIKLDQSMSTVQRALRDFMVADDGTSTGTSNGRYPCPASITAKRSDSDYGVEKRDPATGICQADPDISIYGVTWADSGAGTQKVYIGAVPTGALSIGREAMLDPWKDRLTYAVSATLTENGRPLLGSNPTGAITIEQDGGTATTKAHFVVVSHGLDHAGSYTADGTPHSTVCRTGQGGDAENCDGDVVFADLERVEAQTANFYDDRIAFTLQDDDPEGWLAVTLATSSDIHTLNTGNLGVGVNNPQVKLDVAGSGSFTGDIVAVDIVATGSGSFAGAVKIGTAADSACNTTQLGATRYNQTKDCLEFCANNGGAPVWMTTCNLPHYTDWSAWGGCSASCGPGTQTHTRSCLNSLNNTIACSQCGGVCSGSQSCNSGSCCMNAAGTWRGTISSRFLTNASFSMAISQSGCSISASLCQPDGCYPFAGSTGPGSFSLSYVGGASISSSMSCNSAGSCSGTTYGNRGQWLTNYSISSTR